MAAGFRCADHVTPLYPQKLALTSPTGSGRSVGIVRSRTKATEFSLVFSCSSNSCVSRDKRVGRYGSVATATRYGLNGPVIEPRWGGRDFPHPSRRAWGPSTLLYNGQRVSFPGVKRPGCDADHPSHLAPRLKKEQSYTSASPMGLHYLF